jgi:ribosome-associated protein
VTDPALPAKPRPRTASTKPTAAKTTTAKTSATKTTAAKTTTAEATAAKAKSPKASAAKGASTRLASATTTDAPSADGLPRRGTPAPKPERQPLELARRIVELAEEKKAADIVLLDLTPLTTIADYFVICSGGSERQLDAIADGIASTLRDERTKPIGREGTPASHWVLLDFGSVIVHIFTPPERDYYGLEKHWAEAKTVLRVQ